MDAAFEGVLADYEARAADERAAMRAGRYRPVDELLIYVGPSTGAVLNALAKGLKARTIVELGTSYGYSTLWLAEAARAVGGRVVSLDVAGYKQAYARGMLAKAGLADLVEFRTGDALGLLDAMPGPFDFVLLDIWKHLYLPSLERLAPKLAPNGVIVADNILEPQESRAEMIRYQERVRALPGIESMLLPIGSGIEVSRRVGAA